MQNNDSRFIIISKNVIPIPKINSKYITDLNVKHETKKLLEDKIYMVLSMAMTFLDRLPNAWWMEEKMDKLDFIKIKKLLLFEGQYQEGEMSHRLGKNICKRHTW